MQRKIALVVPLILIFIAIPSHAQNWSGVLDPSRAVDWSNAGIAGGTPNRTTICATLNPGASGAQINSAISSCPSGQVVFLNAGTYNISSIDFGGKSNVTLRGAGADKTFLVFSGGMSCRGLASDICVAAPSNPQMPGPNNTANWTAGYAKGTTSITLSSTSGISVGTILILDQLDDSSDTGNIFVCAAQNVCANEGGNAYGRSGRAQQQLVQVTAVSGNTVTISPGLYMPNWRSSQSPGVSWASGSPSGVGIENLSLDHTNGATGHAGGIVFLYVYNCWVKGIRSVNPDRSHVWLYQTARSVVRDSYFYGTQNAASQSYGIESFSTSDNLVENNIFQHVTGPVTVNGADTGSVWSYNFAIDDYYAVSANWMIPSLIAHEAGIAMDLFEGNDGLGFEGDAIHGTHHFLTVFRNYLYGDTYNNPAKTSNTDVVHLWAFSRYFNVVGNVLGRSPYYNTYEANLSGGDNDIFSLGESPGTGTPSDNNVKTTLMRWGNYDTVNGAARFVNAEVPSGLSQFANPVPSSQSLPASFYRISKPNWFGSAPWPAIGPDVSGGSGPAGHAYAIPAKNCYNSTSKANGILNFNADNCYAASGPAPAPPTNVTAVVR